MGAVPYILFWGLFVYVVLTPKQHVLLYFLFGSMPFGAFAVVSPTIVGVTLTAAPLVMLIIFVKTFFNKDGLNIFTDLSLSKNKLLILFVFWVIGIFTTLTMPYFFQGEITVIPVSLHGFTAGDPIQPTTQNFTQLVYISLSILGVYTFSIFLKNSNYRQHAFKAICFGAVILIITGILDYLSQFIALDFLIEPFKNANYGVLNQEVLGGKRVNGFMPEPSVFASLCLSFLPTIYFFRRVIDNKFIRERLTPILIVLLIIMVFLSTSSSGLVGMSIFAALVFVEWLWRGQMSNHHTSAKKGLMVEFWIFNLLLICILSIALIKPSLFDPVIELFDTMVFKKTESSSYEERTMWTEVSWQALIDSYGIGVGIGSTRASNGVVVLISSVGFLGAFFYFLFVLQSYLRKANMHVENGDLILAAFRWSFIAPFVVDLLIQATPDFGLFNAFLFGLVLAVALGNDEYHNFQASA